MKHNLVLSLLVLSLLVSCTTAVRVAHINRAKMLYLDSVFFPFPDASIVGGYGDKFLEQLERYRLVTQTDTSQIEGFGLSVDSLGNITGTINSDILFAFDKWQIDPLQQVALCGLVDHLKEVAPNSPVSLFGYTDSIGAVDYNLRLSQRRADEVAKVFREKGVVVVSVIGLGETNPVSDNSTPEGRHNNRRVEVHIDGRK